MGELEFIERAEGRKNGLTIAMISDDRAGLMSTQL